MTDMVAFQLSDEQRAALGDLSSVEALPLFDPRDNRAYFLVPADVYERLRAEQGEANRDVEGFYPLMNEIAAREGWDDPEMNVYDQLDPRKNA
jgi:hypothetical protein